MLIEQDCFMASIDIEDAYRSVPNTPRLHEIFEVYS